MSAPARLAAAVSLLLLLTACPKRMAPPSELLEEAAAGAKDPSASARTLALAGFHALLLRGDAAAAQARFDEAVKRDSAEPFALYGLIQLSRRAGHPERGVLIALDLCERAPHHPLATVAARAVLDETGTSDALDELIQKRVPAALQKGPRGDAALLLRSALATVQGARGEPDAQAQTLSALGMPRSWSLVGPLSAYSLLAFDEPTAPERDGALPATLKGDFGAMPVRTLEVPGARLSLAGEPQQGDLYLLAVDAEVAEAGPYLVRSVTGAPHKLYLDGRRLLDRRSFERPLPTVSSAVVELAPGKHRLLLKLSRDERAGDVTLSVARWDGQPSKIAFTPAKGAAPSWTGQLEDAEVKGHVYPGASDLFAALKEEAGETLALFVAARDALARDRDGARRLLAGLPPEASGAAVLGLRADAELADRSVPSKVSRGRAARDLEAALEKDPKDVSALLARATLALDDGVFAQAAELLLQARAAHSPLGYLVPLLQARVELGLGVDAQADELAQEALRIQPGLCEALLLRFDLAKRRDAARLSEELVGALGRCAGSESRVAEHLRSRGKLALAAALLEAVVRREPGNVATRTQLSNAYVGLKQFDRALEELVALERSWPRNAQVVKRQADVLELWQKPKEALAARERALLLDGADLTLRRQVERAKRGRELLDDLAISGQAALEAYQSARGEEDATSAYVLDAAAVRVYPDGTQVDRIHIIQKALDQAGVSEIAEVTIPAGAQLLRLRTLKADGTQLEPETFEHKETVSMPGVQVGDFVEYEYLYAHPPRGPSQPGFTASSFYFQIANQPNNWSTYVVVAPKGTQMAVDPHNTTAPQPRVEGDEEVFRHEQRRVPPYVVEPDAPPSPNEYLPMVTVGAGASGLEGMVALYGDGALDRAQVTFEVEQFARKAAAGHEGDPEGTVRALYAAVMKRILGRDGGLGYSAAASLAQDRGSRLLLLKAGLQALGIPSRMVAVRTFAADPAPYRFPNEALLPYVCLRVTLPDGRHLWLDPLVRFAPFGELPEQVLGGREAYLFPAPGVPVERVTTPPAKPLPPKEVKLSMKLAADGSLRGQGEETYQGHEAAELAEALDSIPPDQRTQALQQALSRYFGGADLGGVQLEMKREVGAPVHIRYEFSVPRFARVEANDKLVLQPLTFPAQLGRRFVQLSTRRTPLYLEGSELSRSTVRLELPAGYRMRDVIGELKASGPSGKFVRREKLEGDVFTVEEEYSVGMARIAVSDYEAFAAFAGEVDLVQSRDLLVEKK